MSTTVLRWLVVVCGVVLTALAMAVATQLWQSYPPGNITALTQAFWQTHAWPTEVWWQAAVLVLYYMVIALSAWPLLLVLLAGGLATWAMWLRFGNEEVSAYLDRVYALEKQLADTRAREDKNLTAWDTLTHNLDTVFDPSGELWLVVTPEGRIRRGNRASLDFARRTYPTIEGLEGKLLAELWTGYGASPLAAAMTKAAKKGEVWHGEMQLAQSATHLLVWVWPLGDDVAVLVRDVTSHYQPEESLRNGEVLARQLVEDSQRPVAVLDGQWRYVYMSRRWLEVFGLDVSQNYIGQPHARVVPSFPPNLAGVSQALALGQTVGNEAEKITIANREEVVSWSIRPWRDASQRLGGYIFTAVPVTELERLRAQVKEANDRENALAYADSLTGLPNRQLFNDRLNMAIALGYRQLSKVALMFIDLDGFKGVNDTLGHEYGDLLLKQVGERLKKATRDTDTVARLGGDEFTIVLNVRERGDAELVAQKVLKTLAEPFNLNGKPAQIGGSVGVAMYPQDGNTAAELIRKADAAMYEAKQAGKNTCRFATKVMVVAG